MQQESAYGSSVDRKQRVIRISRCCLKLKICYGEQRRLQKLYGYIGFVPGEGLYIKLVCVEKDPLRVYKEDQDPVYKDSAMEAFFQFKGNDTAADDIYLNFEMNANGALLACYGKNKMNRIPFTPDQIRKMKCSAEIREEQWNVNLTLPIEILEQVYGKLNLQEGSDFRCNFYKIL